MIVTVVLWLYFAFVFLTYGVGGMVLIRRMLGLQNTSSMPVSVVVLVGLGIAAWLSSLMSLFMKLSLAAHLLFLAGALLILLVESDEIKRLILSVRGQTPWLVQTLIVVTFVTTLLYAVKPTDNPDTTLYHAQAIHWIEEYPPVPGLGNLDPRLGSNSNWFTLHALFSLSFWGGRSFHLIPSFLFLVSALYFLSGLQNLKRGELYLSQFVKLAFVPLAFYVLPDELSSPGTDLPVILFYWITLALWLESMEADSSKLLQAVVFFFSVLIVTFKVSGITVLLIAAQVLFSGMRKGETRGVRAYFILAVLVLLPWLARNFMLTGYWLYPEPAMQFISPVVDWRVPVERVLTFQQGVQAWALSPGTTWDEVAHLSLVERLTYWFSNLTLNQKGIIVVALISPLLFAVFSRLPQTGEKQTSYVPVFVAGYVSFLFWLCAAPNFRFGYGFVLAVIVLAIAPLLQFGLRSLAKYRSYVMAAFILVLLAQQMYAILGSRRDDTRYTAYLMLPADYARVPTDTCSLDGVDLSCARNYRQCGYQAFPCVPQIPRDVELRGTDFSDGFRRVSTEP